MSETASTTSYNMAIPLMCFDESMHGLYGKTQFGLIPGLKVGK